MNRVLLIDDDEIANFINERVIKKAVNAEHINVCGSGKSGLQFLIDLMDKGEPCPEIILLDIRMPLMDGFEFLVEFDKLPVSFNGKVKIAMLTSSLEEEDIQHCFQFKYVVDFINKPITEAKVRAFLSKIG